jgi:hypothetical protein
MNGRINVGNTIQAVQETSYTRNNITKPVALCTRRTIDNVCTCSTPFLTPDILNVLKTTNTSNDITMMFAYSGCRVCCVILYVCITCVVLPALNMLFTYVCCKKITEVHPTGTPHCVVLILTGKEL